MHNFSGYSTIERKNGVGWLVHAKIGGSEIIRVAVAEGKLTRGLTKSMPNLQIVFIWWWVGGTRGEHADGSVASYGLL